MDMASRHIEALTVKISLNAIKESPGVDGARNLGFNVPDTSLTCDGLLRTSSIRTLLAQAVVRSRQ